MTPTTAPTVAVSYAPCGGIPGYVCSNYQYVGFMRLQDCSNKCGLDNNNGLFFTLAVGAASKPCYCVNGASCGTLSLGSGANYTMYSMKGVRLS